MLQGLDRLVALLGLAGHGPHDDLAQPRRQRRRTVQSVFDLAAARRDQGFVGAGRLEGRAASRDLEEQGTHAEHIRAAGNLVSAPLGLLG